MDRTIEIALDGTITLIEGNRQEIIDADLGSPALDQALEVFFTPDAEETL